jgi:hypothetical protein
MVNAAAAQQARGFVAGGGAQLAARTVAVGVDRRLGHAQLAGDLLGAEMLVHEAQAFALTLREQVERLGHGVGRDRHASDSKRRLSQSVYFGSRFLRTRVLLSHRWSLFSGWHGHGEACLTSR